MDRMKAFVCALLGALVVMFAGIASAQEEEVVDADTPYIDEHGNFDSELAEEYAELVDTYVDEDDVEWEIWLDEVGGMVWQKAVGGAHTDDLIQILFYPWWVKVYRYGDDPVTYYRAGGESGQIQYSETCGTNCLKWIVCSGGEGGGDYLPENVTEIEAKGTSAEDYCDANYIGSYMYPDGPQIWESADDYDCWYQLNTYYYWLDDDDPAGNTDYQVGEGMVKFHYHVDGAGHDAKLYYSGPCVI